jgi:tetratricopeptide (TPR) repeat protein
MRRPLWLKALVAPLGLALLCTPLMVAQASNTYIENYGTRSRLPPKYVPLFPDAIRIEPKLRIATKEMDQAITRLSAKVNANNDNDAAIAEAHAILGNPEANRYERAVAEESIAYACLNKGDTGGALANMRKSLDEDALTNNEQFLLMLQLARTLIAAGQADAGLATLDRLVAQTRADPPEYEGIRGRVYYERKDYARAAIALKKATDTTANADPAVQQMLLASYLESKQPDQAVRVGEDLVRTHPGDETILINLASVYQQTRQPEKIIALLDDARRRGVLHSADVYRNLYILYANQKGHEADSAAVIEDGLRKGILQPDRGLYIVLAQDYYSGDRIPEAIDAYRKADAVSSDGNAALNLARIYSNEGHMAEAREAAKTALRKGVAQSGEARSIIAFAEATAPKSAGHR